MVVIGSNISSLRAQRILSNNTDQLRSTFERLSSGLRINSASDDAAGLAISSELKADTRVFTQGVRNLNDGISILNIADGALDELSSIVIRLSELAEQSANGVFGDAQRAALDTEAQELRDEYFRIAKSTTFQDRKLFESDYGTLRIQGGYGLDGSIASGLGGAIGDGTFESASTVSIDGAARDTVVADFNGDGNLDVASVGINGAVNNVLRLVYGNGDGTFSGETTFDEPVGGSEMTIADFNNDNILDIAVSGTLASQASIFLGNGDGTFQDALTTSIGTEPGSIQTGDFNGDGNTDLVVADTKSSEDTISVIYGNGDGTFRDETTIDLESGIETYSVKTGDLDGDGILDIVATGVGTNNANILLGNGDGTFQTYTSHAVGAGDYLDLADLNNDDILDLITVSSIGNTVYTSIGNGDGTFQAITSSDSGGATFETLTGDYNGDGVLDVIAVNNTQATIGILIGKGDGTFEAVSTFATNTDPETVSTGDFNGDGVLDLVTGEGSGTTMSILLAHTEDGVAPLLEIDLTNVIGARDAISMLSDKLEQIDLQRGTIGAFQARLEVAKNALQATATNYEQVNGRIEDADIAQESSELLRLQILQQSATAVLGQANLQGNLATLLLS